MNASSKGKVDQISMRDGWSWCSWDGRERTSGKSLLVVEKVRIPILYRNGISGVSFWVIKCCNNMNIFNVKYYVIFFTVVIFSVGPQRSTLHGLHRMYPWSPVIESVICVQPYILVCIGSKSLKNLVRIHHTPWTGLNWLHEAVHSKTYTSLWHRVEQIILPQEWFFLPRMTQDLMQFCKVLLTGWSLLVLTEFFADFLVMLLNLKGGSFPIYLKISAWMLITSIMWLEWIYHSETKNLEKTKFMLVWHSWS